MTQEEAAVVNEQCHPAFAGYLHDGEMTQRDVLATLFRLMRKGSLKAVFKNDDMTKSIISIMRTSKKPNYKFEQLIIDDFFGKEEEKSAAQIGNAIESGRGQKIIMNNTNAIAQFPITEAKLEMNIGKTKTGLFVNDTDVTDLEGYRKFGKAMWIYIPIMFGVAAWLFIDFLNENDYLSLFGTACFAGMALVHLYIYNVSEKRIKLEFKGDKIPKIRERYDELYEFLRKYPLRGHHFNNEFLEFAIAFGLDTSWNKDFGLKDELRILR